MQVSSAQMIPKLKTRLFESMHASDSTKIAQLDNQSNDLSAPHNVQLTQKKGAASYR